MIERKAKCPFCERPLDLTDLIWTRGKPYLDRERDVVVKWEWVRVECIACRGHDRMLEFFAVLTPEEAAERDRGVYDERGRVLPSEELTRYLMRGVGE